MKNILIIPAILDSYRSLKDRTLKVSFETSEPSPEQMAGIQQSIQKAGYLAFKSDPFVSDEIEAIEGLRAEFNDTGKTPSQRLRGVIFRNYEANAEGYTTFEDYYRVKMEKIINHLKSKLP